MKKYIIEIDTDNEMIIKKITEEIRENHISFVPRGSIKINEIEIDE